MTEQQVWVIPGDPSDMAPLPVLLKDGDQIAYYNRRSQEFGSFIQDDFNFGLTEAQSFADFESCRAAMIAERSAMLEDLNRICRDLAASIEHIKFIPTADFPNVSREVREQGQQEEDQEPEEKAEGQQQEAVKPPPQLKRRPSRS